MASFGISDAENLAQAALVIIKFWIFFSYTDEKFPDIDKYRVLGKYLASILKYVTELSKIRRRLKYKLYKLKMLKYKN